MLGPESKHGTRRQNQCLVPPDEFVRAWQESANLAEFCERTGYKPRSASTRAGYFREVGVPLKHMDRHATRRLDIATLVAIVDNKDDNKP
jgi:hypothetical protein